MDLSISSVADTSVRANVGAEEKGVVLTSVCSQTTATTTATCGIQYSTDSALYEPALKRSRTEPETTTTTVTTTTAAAEAGSDSSSASNLPCHTHKVKRNWLQRHTDDDTGHSKPAECANLDAFVPKGEPSYHVASTAAAAVSSTSAAAAASGSTVKYNEAHDHKPQTAALDMCLIPKSQLFRFSDLEPTTIATTSSSSSTTSGSSSTTSSSSTTTDCVKTEPSIARVVSSTVTTVNGQSTTSPVTSSVTSPSPVAAPVDTLPPMVPTAEGAEGPTAAAAVGATATATAAAAGAATAAAAVVMSPKRPTVSVASQLRRQLTKRRPSLGALRRSGASFVQHMFCHRYDRINRLPRCRECRLKPGALEPLWSTDGDGSESGRDDSDGEDEQGRCQQQQRQRLGDDEDDGDNIYCRFVAFRKLRYSRSGQIVVAGFCHPTRDADADDCRLWLPAPAPATPPDGGQTALGRTGRYKQQLARLMLRHVGAQFCRLVEQEEAARAAAVAAAAAGGGGGTAAAADAGVPVAWKRVVAGCREMCDVCQTTLFNTHWVCSKCGYAVCPDCYLLRQKSEHASTSATAVVTSSSVAAAAAGTDTTSGTSLVSGVGDQSVVSAATAAVTDQLQWLPCNNRQLHVPARLMMTCIVAGDALQTLNRHVHSARRRAGLSPCHCSESQRQQQQQQQGDGHDSKMSVIGGRQLLDDSSESEQSEDDERGQAAGTALRQLLGVTASAPPPAAAAPTTSVGAAASGSGGREKEEDGDEDDCLTVSAGRGMRVMTLTESRRRFPLVAHSWLCDGKLLLLELQNTPTAAAAGDDQAAAAGGQAAAAGEQRERLFRDQWRCGQPVLCSGVGQRLRADLWSVDSFLAEFGHLRHDLVDCTSGDTLADQSMRRFWLGFVRVADRLRDAAHEPMILKLKDWPPGEDFSDLMPSRFADLMAALPMPEYTRRDGRLNLASCLPDAFVPPDLGPKMYIAYGCAHRADRASTNLHLDVSDAVNIMVHVTVPEDEWSMSAGAAAAATPKVVAGDWPALTAINEAGCDPLTKERARHRRAGALWHIYRAADADKIRHLLNRVAVERGYRLEPRHDPIHDQSWYLDGPLRQRLYAEYGVEGFPIVQCDGDALFVPAGAPHQVRNLHSCIKVAEDFVSPENVGHCFDLTQEFRSLSDTHTNHEDKLQIKNIVYHAMKEVVSYWSE